MSFSTDAKDELARLFPDKVCCRIAELAALIRMDGTITISTNHEIALVITTESAPVARKIFRLFKEGYKLEPEILVQRRRSLKKNNVYSVRLSNVENINQILVELGILDKRGDILPGIKPSLIKSLCCRRSYLRGVFLGAGSVNNPEGNYHLEIITNNDFYAQEVADLINRFPGMSAKVSSRKNWYVVYLKESEQIASFLNIVGAHQALLDFENIRVLKDMRNKVNRLVNCDTANLKKSVNASLKQIENIKLIDAKIGLEKLPVRLREVARLRLENPDSSLKELGEMMATPMGKSGVNHRLRKIEAIAEALRNK
ncbi:MAG TPA: DNA-binding protein WhiA [Peptococcaceae bacterium]|nr:DNA-binding protein WhiA [Peptococcaceae bacterium]HPZ71850.1 DNA-binding protein WhiA [Peptococcaceae bacterium]